MQVPARTIFIRRNLSPKNHVSVLTTASGRPHAVVCIFKRQSKIVSVTETARCSGSVPKKQKLYLGRRISLPREYGNTGGREDRLGAGCLNKEQLTSVDSGVGGRVVEKKKQEGEERGRGTPAACTFPLCIPQVSEKNYPAITSIPGLLGRVQFSATKFAMIRRNRLLQDDAASGLGERKDERRGEWEGDTTQGTARRSCRKF